MPKRNIIHFYKNHPSMKQLECFYCGCYGESKDHIPPVSYPDEYQEGSRIIVRACLLCNSMLGNRYFLTLLSRCGFLLIRYQRKFHKTLSMPLWTEDEVEELTGKLKRIIILGQKKKRFIENKIKFLKQNICVLQGYPYAD